MTKNNDIYSTLSAINVKGLAKDRNGLTYLPWAKAWDLFKHNCPEATYEVKKNEQGLPYFESALGFMVYTSVSVGEVTHEMWLPVMDGANRALKAQAQEFQKMGKDGKPYTVTVPAATMSDVNKAVMRCLTKNLAMFGLGIHIYEGEDNTMAEKEAALESSRLSALQGVATADANYLDAIAPLIPKTDKEFRDAMMNRLHTIIMSANDMTEVVSIYNKSKWAQALPELVGWCKEKKEELSNNTVA